MMSRGDRFKRRALKRGYKVDEVDDFLERVEATLDGEAIDDPVAAEDVRDVVFRTRWGGYDEWQVDLELDRLERELVELEAGNSLAFGGQGSFGGEGSGGDLPPSLESGRGAFRAPLALPAGPSAQSREGGVYGMAHRVEPQPPMQPAAAPVTPMPPQVAPLFPSAVPGSPAAVPPPPVTSSELPSRDQVGDSFADLTGAGEDYADPFAGHTPKASVRESFSATQVGQIPPFEDGLHTDERAPSSGGVYASSAQQVSPPPVGHAIPPMGQAMLPSSSAPSSAGGVYGSVGENTTSAPDSPGESVYTSTTSQIPMPSQAPASESARPDFDRPNEYVSGSTGSLLPKPASVPPALAPPSMPPVASGPAGSLGTQGMSGMYPGRHGKSEMTVEMPTYAGATSPFTTPDRQRCAELRSSFKTRRFGTGYDEAQVKRFFEAVAAAMDGQAGVEVSASDFDPQQFALVQGGYFEDEVESALEELRQLFERRMG